jgi:hypothetical protein
MLMYCWKLEFIVLLLGLFHYHSVSAIAATVKKTARGITAVSSAPPQPRIVDSYDGPGSHDNNAVDTYTIPPPSPRCWKTAWKLFQHVQQDQHSSDAQAMCSVMPEAQQKALALEIARCHLQDLGIPLIKDRAMLHQCSEGQQQKHQQDSPFDDTNNTVLQKCLKSLTAEGINAYTHYISYVQQLCTRLTAEHMVHHVTSRYQAVSQQSLDHMETLSSMWSEKHAEQMNSLSEIPAMIKDQLTMELKEQLRETVKEQLSEQLQIQLREHLEAGIGDLLQQQAIEQASFLTHIMGHIEVRDSEQKETYESWTQHQTTQFQNQARDMERQRAKMQALDDIVSTTTRNMQPLVGLQSLVAAATEGYTWITFLLYFLGTFNVVWLFTRPQRCHGFRCYLFAVVLLEAVFELSLKAMIDYDWISESDRTLAIDEVRRWALYLECLAYIAGLVSSFFVDQTASIQQETLQQKMPVLDRRDAIPEQSMNAHANASGNTHMIPRSFVHQHAAPNHHQYSELASARDQHLSMSGDYWYGPPHQPPPPPPLPDGGRPFQAGRRPNYHDQGGDGAARYFPSHAEVTPYSCYSSTGMEDRYWYESTEAHPAYTRSEWTGDQQVLPPYPGWPRYEYENQQQQQQQYSPTRSPQVHSVQDATPTHGAPGIGSPPAHLPHPPITSTVPDLIHAPPLVMEQQQPLPDASSATNTNELSRKRPATENDSLHESEQSPSKKGRHIGL